MTHDNEDSAECVDCGGIAVRGEEISYTGETGVHFINGMIVDISDSQGPR